MESTMSFAELRAFLNIYTRNSLQHLVNSGVIQALPETEGRGTGIRRKFPFSEALIGRVLGALVGGGMDMALLSQVATGLREHFKVLETPEEDRSGFFNRGVCKAIEAAREGGEAWLVVRLSSAIGGGRQAQLEGCTSFSQVFPSNVGGSGGQGGYLGLVDMTAAIGATSEEPES